jgi:hypothetical protein
MSAGAPVNAVMDLSLLLLRGDTLTFPLFTMMLAHGAIS